MILKGRAAIVTGAGSGIGRGIALALSRAGARVAVVDVNEAGARAVVREIENESGTAEAYKTDVTKKAEVDRMVASVSKRWGSVDILVNNAGWDRPIPFIETTEEFWEKILAVNLKSVFICTRAVREVMVKQGAGTIVNISSDAGRVGSTGEAIYSAAKGGIIAFTKTIAREMARYHINVNCVCPGPSDTPLFQEEFAKKSPRLAESLTRFIPWGRLGTPEDVAPAVVFLASDAAEYITGQTLSVSGGLTMA
jgi:2-hydroxycyclohexanecarboxyl-CoA dehydrogenase